MLGWIVCLGACGHSLVIALGFIKCFVRKQCTIVFPHTYIDIYIQVHCWPAIQLGRCTPTSGVLVVGFSQYSSVISLTLVARHLHPCESTPRQLCREVRTSVRSQTARSSSVSWERWHKESAEIPVLIHYLRWYVHAFSWSTRFCSLFSFICLRCKVQTTTKTFSFILASEINITISTILIMI